MRFLFNDISDGTNSDDGLEDESSSSERDFPFVSASNDDLDNLHSDNRSTTSYDDGSSDYDGVFSHESSSSFSDLSESSNSSFLNGLSSLSSAEENSESEISDSEFESEYDDTDQFHETSNIFGRPTTKRTLNIVDLLNQKQIGRIAPAFPRSAKKILLQQIVTSRWFSVGSFELLEDAKLLLGRKLHHWEKRSLEHILEFGIVLVPRDEQEGDDLIKLVVECEHSLVPSTFVELLDALHKSGADLNCTDPTRGRNFVLKIVNEGGLGLEHRHIFKIVCLLRDCGIPINTYAIETLKLLCDDPNYLMSKYSVKLFELLLNAVDSKNCKLICSRFFELLSKVPEMANAHSAEIVRLFVHHNLVHDKALDAFCTNETFLECFDSSEKLIGIYTIFNILMENNPRCRNPNMSTMEDSSLWQIYQHLSRKHAMPSYIDLIRGTAQLGLGSSKILHRVCKMYSEEDLADAVKLLCESGVNVNAIDDENKTILFALSENYPATNRAVYDTVRLLLEKGINVNHPDDRLRIALHDFIDGMPSGCCCWYSMLTELNKSYYWDTLDLLMDAGTQVEMPDGAGSTVLAQLLLNLRNSDTCSDCSKVYSSSKKHGDHSSQLFTRALNFAERLLKAGSSFEANLNHNIWMDNLSCEKENVFFYVLANFQDEFLVNLVELFCRYGVNVNAKTKRRYDFLSGRYSSPKNAIQLLRKSNRSQVHLVDQLISIMKDYGFNT